MSDPSFITCSNCQSECVSGVRFRGQCKFERSRSGVNSATFPTEVPQQGRSTRILDVLSQHAKNSGT
jgi:hypothetical protein